MSSGFSFTWLTWAKTVPGLAPSPRLVLCELARLADGEGSVVASVPHLVQATGLSKRSVYRALKRLEADRHIEKAHRFDTAGRQCASAYHLLGGGAEAMERAIVLTGLKPPSAVGTSPSDVPGRPSAHGSLPNYLRLAVESASAECRLSDAHFAELLRLGAECEWTEPLNSALSEVLQVSVPRQFHSAVEVAVRCGLNYDDAVSDALSLAWRIVRQQALQIADKRSPWAYLTRAVRQGIADELMFASETAVDTTVLSEIRFDDVPVFSGADPVASIAALTSTQLEIIDHLVAAGLSETIAHAGTVRMVEVALRTDASRRTSVVASDSRVADLGINPAAARLWLNLTVPGRRKTILDIAETAREIVSLMLPDAAA